MWSAAMQIRCNKRKHSHKKRVQLPQEHQHDGHEVMWKGSIFVRTGFISTKVYSVSRKEQKIIYQLLYWYPRRRSVVSYNTQLVFASLSNGPYHKEELRDYTKYGCVKDLGEGLMGKRALFIGIKLQAEK